jgi:NitT/TauT family transport system substrate-binding protein
MDRRVLIRAVLIRAVSAAAVAVMLGSAAACAKEPATTNGTDSGGETKVTLAFSAWPGWFPWQIAEEKGLFEANGVNVELKYFDSYTDSLSALATGQIDANSQTLNDTLASISGGAKQTIVLVNDNSTGNDQIIVRDGINTLADLKGRTVAVEESTVDHYLLLLALQKAGLTEKDITLKPLLTADAAAAFASGQVDAVGAFAPFTSNALARPGSKVIASSADFPGAIPDHLVFTADFVRDHPDEVQKIVKTWFDTITWISANKDEAITIMAKKAGVSADEYKTYDGGTTIFNRDQNLAAFASGTAPTNLDYQAGQIADFLVATGLTPTKPTLDGLFEPKFVQAVAP